MSYAAAIVVGWTCAAVAAIIAGVAVPLPRRRHAGDAVRLATARRRLWLQQAGIPVSPLRFAAASLGLAAVAFIVLQALSSAVVAFFPALAVSLIPLAFYSRRRTQRLARVAAAWPDGLRDILASISAGQTLHQALVALAAHGPAALRDAFERFPALARALGMTPALETIREELADPVSDRVIEVLILAHERGGVVVRSVLEDLSAAITADLRVIDEIHTAVLESRINARAVVILPWLVLVFLNIERGPFRSFYGSPAGFVVVSIGAVLSVLGSALIGRLGRLPVEQRVFGEGSAR